MNLLYQIIKNVQVWFTKWALRVYYWIVRLRPMLVFIFSMFLVTLVLGGAIFIAHGGMDLCEGEVMVKTLVGGFFAVYAIAALALKLVLPTLPANQVDVASLIPGELKDALPTINLEWPWTIDTAFGAH